MLLGQAATLGKSRKAFICSQIPGLGGGVLCSNHQLGRGGLLHTQEEPLQGPEFTVLLLSASLLLSAMGNTFSLLAQKCLTIAALFPASENKEQRGAELGEENSWREVIAPSATSCKSRQGSQYFPS